MSLEDSLWEPLYALEDCGLPIAGFLKDNSIPVYLPYVLIIALLILPFLSLSFGPAPPSLECGDGACEGRYGEDCHTCPEDCGSCVESRELTLKITEYGCPLKLTIMNEDDMELASQQGRRTEFVFPAIKARRYYVIVEGAEGNTHRTRILEGNAEIKPSKDLCAVSALSPTEGRLVVVLKDAETKQRLTSDITLVDIETGLAIQKNVEEHKEIQVKANSFYKIVVTKEGYERYESNPFFVLSKRQKTVIVKLTPANGTIAEGAVMVCVKDNSSYVAPSTINLLESGVNIAKEQTDEGCHTFTLPEGSKVSAFASSLPKGCTSVQTKKVQIQAEQLKTLDIRAKCVTEGTPEQNGNVSVLVRDNRFRILTNQSTITLYSMAGRIPGSNPDGTLNVTGDYTETVEVPAGRVYARASQVPEGYLDTASDYYDASPGETQEIEIVLREIPRNIYERPFAALVYSSMTPNPAVLNRVVKIEAGLVNSNSTEFYRQEAEAKCTIGYPDTTENQTAHCSPGACICLVTPRAVGTFPVAFELSFNNQTLTEELQPLEVLLYSPGGLDIKTHIRGA